MRHPTHREVKGTLQKLRKMFPGPGAMEVGNAYQSLVAVLLSARTRDEQVLKLLPAFFDRFPTSEKLASASTGQIEARIHTIGMYRQKARNLKKLAERLVAAYAGVVPDSIEELTTLAGVGRKTASVILPYIFQKPAIAVDTHVHRVTNRLGWVHTRTPEKTEKALLKLIPPKLHPIVNRVFVKFGRYICITKPRCWACPLVRVCAYQHKHLDRPKNAVAVLKTVQRREEELQQLRRKVIDYARS